VAQWLHRGFAGDLVKLEGSMRVWFPVMSVAALVAVGCNSNLTNHDGGTGGGQTGGDYGDGGSFGTGGYATGGTLGTGGFATGGDIGTGGFPTGGTSGFDAGIDAVAGIACAALAEPTGSPPPVPPQPGCPCTRAPGRGNSYLCPMGVGQTAYTYVGPEGGSIYLLGQQSAKTNVPIAIDIPPGAIATQTLISVSETDLAPPSGFVDWSPVYLVEPRGLQLAKVAGLQIPWSSNISPPPTNLAIYARDENGSCGFKALVDSYTNAGFEQASLTELGYLFVGVPSTVDPSTCGALDAAVGD
jgi:hypothetical protein